MGQNLFSFIAKSIKSGAAALLVDASNNLRTITGLTYNTVAAGQTAQALTGGNGGAVGDTLECLTIIPAAANCGAVSIKDGSGTAITLFAGGGTSALQSLAPINIELYAISTNGPWQITTGANVSVIATGAFA
jgi:hypothetical protein